MAAPKCPNPQCEYFNRMLPNAAKFCPMCNTSVIAVGGAAAQPQQQPAQQQWAQPQNNPAQGQPQAQWAGQQPQWSPQGQQPVVAARPTLKLVHTTLGREFPMRGDVSFIGRRGGTVKPSPEIDLTGIPNDNVISRPHAQICWDPTYMFYTIIDEGSRNGSFVNGQLLNPGVAYQLANGDILQLGKDNLVQFAIKLA